ALAVETESVVPAPQSSRDAAPIAQAATVHPTLNQPIRRSNPRRKSAVSLTTTAGIGIPSEEGSDLAQTNAADRVERMAPPRMRRRGTSPEDWKALFSVKPGIEVRPYSTIWSREIAAGAFGPPPFSSRRRSVTPAATWPSCGT